MKGKPNSVQIATDIEVELTVKPGSVPKTAEELADFAAKLSPALADHGASWARYILFDENGDPDIEFDETILWAP